MERYTRVRIISLIGVALLLAVFARGQETTLSIDPGFPQDSTYSFTCDPDFEATSFDWDFGDGLEFNDIADDNIFHTYLDNGTFNVTCTAMSDTESASDSLLITVGDDAEQQNITNETNGSVVVIKEVINDNNGTLSVENFTLRLNGNAVTNGTANSVTPGVHTVSEDAVEGYNGTIGGDCAANGTVVVGSNQTVTCVITNNDNPPVNDTLDLVIVSPLAQEYNTTTVPLHLTTNIPANITYNVDGGANITACTDCMNHTDDLSVGQGNHTLDAFARTANQSDDESVNFSVTNATTPPTNDTNVSGPASITIKEWYPQTGAYVFECNTPGFTPASYSWFFGDDMKNLEIQNQNVFHTYTENGNFHVVCQGHDAGGNVVREASLDISISDIPRHNTCSAMQNEPATCEGGTITQQELGESCRTIICEGDGQTRTVLACDKPSADNPLYFHMYDQNVGTPTDLRICLVGTCLEPDAGFVQSDFLVCNPEDANGVNETDGNETNQTGNQSGNQTGDDDGDDDNGDDGGDDNGEDDSGEASVSLNIASGFPQDLDVVLVCTPDGFSPTSFNWEFGDGATQTSANDNVFHTYPTSGSFDASCSATDGTVTEEDDLTVTV